MRQFDPWPVFFRREFSRTWPFLVGFGITGAVITKLSLGLTEEDAKKSKFVQRHKKCCLSTIKISLCVPGGREGRLRAVCLLFS
ncbi:hypothetical protein DM860_013550 [Cuscuta australis]|uniref:Uncharacterized protein n=1 Tax=Cuscuta australis TaxID=267555 RepID=A0A328EA62_9ASTE|nr:hypothetical protein DM860_013550 [Cuscuta australis]